jgi:5-methylthioribose kinase
MPIITDFELRKFLSSKDIPCHEVEPLTDGAANYCWRIKTLLGRRSIVKHAEPWIRIVPEQALSADRMDYEYAALQWIPDVVPVDEFVQLPRVFHYFTSEHVMDMHDGGMATLKDGYINDSELDIPTLGSRIGTWLARLHATTSKSAAREIVKERFNNGTAKQLARVSYNSLGNMLELCGHDRKLGERINEKFGSKLETDRVCLCHGDFWPGNFMLEDSESDIKVEEAERAPLLTIIDWELVRLGNGATDIGQFAAMAWLLDRFHGGKSLMGSFLAAYLRERQLDEKDKIRVVVHFGVCLVFYTEASKLVDAEGTKEAVRVGKEMLEAVDVARPDKLRAGPLEALFNEA